MVRFIAGVAALALLAPSHPVSASDGVIEINQAIAAAGGVNGSLAADPAGFPVRITQPGSYRLTGNLTIPVGQTGIQIDAINVTLDLAGFMVSGPNACTGYPTTSCTYTLGPAAIASGQFLVAVRNGTVINAQGEGVSLSGPSSEVDQVRVIASGSFGIDIGGAGRVSRCFSGANLLTGIFLGDGSTAIDNEVRANGTTGIQVIGGARLSSSIIGNRAFDNAYEGIFVPDSNSLVSRNVASDNAFNPQILGGRSLGDNLCDATFC